MIDGLYPANIVALNDGSLITESGWQSTNNGHSWRESDTFNAPQGKPAPLGLVRLPNGQLGTYYADTWTLETALGNATNNWFFCWSNEGGRPKAMEDGGGVEGAGRTRGD